MCKQYLSLGAVLLGGCAGIGDYTTVARLNETQYEPTKEVFLFPDKPPPRSYDIFAKLETNMGEGVKLGQLYDSMRAKAKEIGADAVINLTVESDTITRMDTGSGLGGMIGLGGGVTTRNDKIMTLKGDAIRYK